MDWLSCAIDGLAATFVFADTGGVVSTPSKLFDRNPTLEIVLPLPEESIFPDCHQTLDLSHAHRSAGVDLTHNDGPGVRFHLYACDGLAVGFRWAMIGSFTSAGVKSSTRHHSKTAKCLFSV